MKYVGHPYPIRALLNPIELLLIINKKFNLLLIINSLYSQYYLIAS